jgi:chemotaxis protein methyltransferase WspC
MVPGSERRLLGLLWTGAVRRERKVPSGRFARPVLPREDYADTGTGWFQKPLLTTLPPPTLAPPAPSSAPAAPLPSPEETVLAAEKAMADGQRYEALAAIEDVLPRTAGAARVRARILRARILLKDVERLHDAEAELRRLLQEAPDNADAYYLQGLVAKRAGAAKRAQSLFSKALELNPKHSAARSEAAALLQEAAPAPEEGAGLLKRLFSKSS